MIEILTASVIWLFALTIYLFVRKLRKPKPMDEIKLQKIHVMRLGPFSGQSNSFKGKSVVFMMLLSTFSYAEVNIITLDNFWIDDVSESELSVAKKAEDGIRDESESRGLGDVYKRQNKSLGQIAILLML